MGYVVITGIATFIALILARQISTLQRLRSDDQIRAETQEKELSDLQETARRSQALIVEYEARLLELNRVAQAYRERLDRLSRFEKLGTLEALDAELLKLRQQEQEYRAKINDMIHTANLRAKKIIADADVRAEEIAGDAAKVAQDVRQYERAVTAMKNIISGYGSQYIIPAQSLLDELAKLYGHLEAGRELKSARAHSKQMVISGIAASCEYVEANRKDTAIAFVTDAFNGKVDSILTRTKRDNYGKLRQEVLDAFSLVNLNGKAFRSARITDEYLNARLEELKWACAAQELRMLEMEEQRRIREQMREEQKARRDYERAIKEAARDESALRKALEKAHQQLAVASEEQRVAYEAKLLELEDKLRAAEEKNMRALSMAQQTKSGYVYIISNVGSFGDAVYKIGMTRRLEPLDRVKELGDASVPFDFDVHALIKAEDAPALETALHRHFVLSRVNKVNHRREFFRASIDEIKRRIDSIGIDVNVEWTMAAEARQYYETLAIEESIAKSPAAAEAWVQNQFKYDAEDLAAMRAGRDWEEAEVEDV